jgi:hypothetical protein
LSASSNSIPSLAIAVARSLTRRLMRGRLTPSPRSGPREKYLFLMGALPAKERLRFILNLSLSTLDQTRRRVLLVEVAEESGEPAVALLSRKPAEFPDHMDLHDFQTIEGLRSLTLSHASGLDLISISEPLASRAAFRRALSAYGHGAARVGCRVPLVAGPIVTSGPSPLGRSRSRDLCPGRIRRKRRPSLAGNGARCPLQPVGLGRAAREFPPPPESARTVLHPLAKRDWTMAPKISFSHRRTGPFRKGWTEWPATWEGYALVSPWGPGRRWGIPLSEFCARSSGTEFIPT